MAENVVDISGKLADKVDDGARVGCITMLKAVLEDFEKYGEPDSLLLMCSYDSSELAPNKTVVNLSLAEQHFLLTLAARELELELMGIVGDDND